MFAESILAPWTFWRIFMGAKDIFRGSISYWWHGD